MQRAGGRVQCDVVDTRYPLTKQALCKITMTGLSVRVTSSRRARCQAACHCNMQKPGRSQVAFASLPLLEDPRASARMSLDHRSTLLLALALQPPCPPILHRRHQQHRALQLRPPQRSRRSPFTFDECRTRWMVRLMLIH
jgi:hypothetical protein